MTAASRRILTLAAVTLAIGGAALAAPPAATLSPPSNAAAEADARLHSDWAWMSRYRDADKALIASGKRVDVVFMGDSITLGWYDKVPGYFREGLVDRGIGGQTSPQMLVRFRQDVIALHPRAVHIMMGTNDIAGNTGPMSPEETEANVETLGELARLHHIRVILASIPPALGFPWRPGVAAASRIRALNAWIKTYAVRTGAVYADYTAVLDDGQGGMKPGLAVDGVHPTPAGYALMAPVADRAIAEALRRPAP
jgi:lysophospholipase L1-like esterase